MFRDLPRYEAYAAAGEWIAEVPCGWGWEPARTIFAERKVTDFVDEQMLSVTIGRGVLPQADLIASTSKKDSSNIDKSKYKLVEPGDVVYNKMRAWQGAAGRSQHRGIVSPAYIVMTPRSVRSEYLHHLARTPMFAKEAERWSYGITSDQWSLRPEHFKMIRFPVPPPEEQAAIVKYLAHANARVDKAIAAKRRLIALLEEEKKAIADVLLGQLDEGAREVRHVLSQLVDCEHKTAPFVEGEPYWVLRTSSVKSGEMVWSGAYTTDAASYEEWTSRAVPEPGDVIFTREAPVGEAAVITDGRRVALGQRTVLMKVRKEIMDPQFLVYQVYAGLPRRRISLATQGSTVGHFNMDDIGWMRVAVPDIEVQRQLVSKIEDANSDANEAIDKTQSEIALLQEFRTRLVADVVTGQVDVRAIAATLPEVPECEIRDLDDQVRTLESEPGDEELADE